MSLSKKAERLQRQEQEWQKEKEILGLKDVPLNDYLVELFIDAETGNIEL